MAVSSCNNVKLEYIGLASIRYNYIDSTLLAKYILKRFLSTQFDMTSFPMLQLCKHFICCYKACFKSAQEHCRLAILSSDMHYKLQAEIAFVKQVCM